MFNTTQIKSEKEFKRKSDTTTPYATMTEKKCWQNYKSQENKQHSEMQML